MRARVSILSALVMVMLTQMTNAVYFYAQKGKWRCFSDTVVKNNVSGFKDISLSWLLTSDTYVVYYADSRNGSPGS